VGFEKVPFTDRKGVNRDAMNRTEGNDDESLAAGQLPGDRLDQILG